MSFSPLAPSPGRRRSRIDASASPSQRRASSSSRYSLKMTGAARNMSHGDIINPTGTFKTLPNDKPILGNTSKRRFPSHPSPSANRSPSCSRKGRAGDAGDLILNSSTTNGPSPSGRKSFPIADVSISSARTQDSPRLCCRVDESWNQSSISLIGDVHEVKRKNPKVNTFHEHVLKNGFPPRRPISPKGRKQILGISHESANDLTRSRDASTTPLRRSRKMVPEPPSAHQEVRVSRPRRSVTPSRTAIIGVQDAPAGANDATPPCPEGVARISRKRAVTPHTLTGSLTPACGAGNPDGVPTSSLPYYRNAGSYGNSVPPFNTETGPSSTTASTEARPTPTPSKGMTTPRRIGRNDPNITSHPDPTILPNEAADERQTTMKSTAHFQMEETLKKVAEDKARCSTPDPTMTAFLASGGNRRRDSAPTTVLHPCMRQRKVPNDDWDPSAPRKTIRKMEPDRKHQPSDPITHFDPCQSVANARAASPTRRRKVPAPAVLTTHLTGPCMHINENAVSGALPIARQLQNALQSSKLANHNAHQLPTGGSLSACDASSIADEGSVRRGAGGKRVFPTNDTSSILSSVPTSPRMLAASSRRIVPPPNQQPSGTNILAWA